MRMFMENSPTARHCIVIMSLVFGGIILAVSASLITTTSGTFLMAYTKAFTLGGGDGGFEAGVNSLTAALAGSALMVLSCIPGIIGSIKRIQFLVFVFLIMSFVGSLVAIIGGASFYGVPSLLGPRIYIKSRNEMTTNPLVGLESDMSDFGLAVYNECCVKVGWAAQSMAKPCTGSSTLDCPDILDERVSKSIPGAKSVLCMCASSQEKLDAFQAAISATPGLCLAAQNALVNVDGYTLPREAGSLKFQTLTQNFFPDLNPYSYVPLVGWYEVPNTNPDPTNQQRYPFGCGVGYQKGLAMFTDSWFQQNTMPPATMAIALGLANLAILIFAAAVAGVSDRDADTNRVDRWANVSDKPAEFAITAAPASHPNSQATQFQQTNSRSLHLQLQQQQQTGNMVAPNPQFTDPAMFDKVSAFYAKFEPNKSVADVEDVAKWASINGVDALNAKLQSKYGTDLNSFTAEIKENKGAKALDGDLDI